jgi:membrane-associated phospholipid phosphatase
MISLSLAAIVLIAWLLACGLPALVSGPVDRAVALVQRRLADGETWLARTVPKPLVPYVTEAPLIASLAGLLIFGTWAFFEILEHVTAGDPLVRLDIAAYGALQAGRSASLDAIMIAITQLGDAKVVIPVAVAAIATLTIVRQQRAAAYLFAAVGGAAVFVAGVKRVIQRPRPVSIYDGLAEYSFPSGHASMSIVLYGFLAVLLAWGAPPALRRVTSFAAVLLVLLIGFSRVYLGAHWLSDVLAGLAFGLAWVALLTLVYTRTNPPAVPAWVMITAVVLALGIAGGYHNAHDFQGDVERYAVPGVPR